MKQLIVFDLDGTLAESKSSLDEEMARLLTDLLGVVRVAVISGGAWPQFEKQLLTLLPHDHRLQALSLLPTCGTKYFSYDTTWEQLYSEDLTEAEKARIIDALHQAGSAWSRPRRSGEPSPRTVAVRSLSQHWDSRLRWRPRCAGTRTSPSGPR